MELSASSLAPKQPYATPVQRKHPLYKEWLNYKHSCATQLIDACDFESWRARIEQGDSCHVYQHVQSLLWGWHILSKTPGSDKAPKMVAGERPRYETEIEADAALERRYREAIDS